MNKEITKELLEKENIPFNNIEPYHDALTHMSYSHESKGKAESYERLEFLGDSVLGKVVSEHLYLKYPEYYQGEMTLVKHFVVNKKYLAEIGRKIGFQKYLLLGAGEDRNGLSDSVFEDVFESLVGAIYVDLGIEEAQKFIGKYILSKIDSISLDDVKDPKTKLQELLQAEKRDTVRYEIIKQERVGNLMNFEALAKFEGEVLGRGKGLSKKEAEQDAAKNAIERMVV